MKILNLYCGIGGNRKLWGDEHEVTAVEIDEQIAKIYQEFHPKDKVIVADAHQYLLEHFKEYDFIWSSPPCQTHSTMAKLCGNSLAIRTGNHRKKPKYPDMKLYEEIIFLQHYYNGLWVVENVIPYYKTLIEGKKLQRHIFWSNFDIKPIKFSHDNIKWGRIKNFEERHGFNLDGKQVDKRKVLRNCVYPPLAKHILDCALNIKVTTNG